MTWRIGSSGEAELVPVPKVALSTISTYPKPTATGFETAARLGYDGVEVMVTNDPVSQDIDALKRLSDHYQLPILAIHAPCLFWLNLQRVWGADPWAKLVRARKAAEALGAPTVVVHPAFRWQQPYATEFVRGIRNMAQETDVVFAVENMYPWRPNTRVMGTRQIEGYAPSWDPTEQDYTSFTLDLSHTAKSGSDALAMAARMGDALAHVHLADGSGANRDEHLVPGRGNQPCAELLALLGRRGFGGSVVLEVSTRRATGRDEREADLREALVFTRLHLAQATRAARGGVDDGMLPPADARSGAPES